MVKYRKIVIDEFREKLICKKLMSTVWFSERNAENAY
jgi:hypothetical protein